MRIIGLFIFLLLPFTALSQNNVLSRKIVWNEPALVPDRDDHRVYREVLHFGGAVYEDSVWPAPSYFELLPYASGGDLSASFDEMEFLPLTGREEKLAAGIAGLTDRIEPYLARKHLRKQTVWEISFVPLRKNPASGRIEKLVSFTLHLEEARAVKKSTPSAAVYAPGSVLRTGTWYKLSVKSDGIYKLSYSQLKSLGINSPADVRIFGNGGSMLSFMNADTKPDDLREVAIWFEKGSDGIFNEGDYILFYGEGPGAWNYQAATQEFVFTPHLYATSNFYFLTTGTGPGKTVQPLTPPAMPYTHQVNSFNAYLHLEKDLQNFIKSGREWWEPLLNYTPTSYNFLLPNIETSAPVSVFVRAAARSPLPSSFNVKLNGANLMDIPFGAVDVNNYIGDYASVNSGSSSGTSSGDQNNITLTFSTNGVPSSSCWLDHIRINARRKLIMSGSQMHFSDALSAGTGNISKFELGNAGSGITVWEISDPLQCRRVITTPEANGLSFILPTDSILRFVAFSQSGFLTPGIDPLPVPNQDLHGPGAFDMIILSHPDFLDHARQLADIHGTEDGLRCRVVTPREVYNEFSSGKPDVSAVRNYMKMLYDRAAVPEDIPRYLLLFGDGSFDNLSDHPGNTNYILTYQSRNSVRPTQSFVTDDYFGLLDEDEGEYDGLLDIGIGRLPVTSSEEAGRMLSKIIRYRKVSQQGDWKNNICFIGDDEDYNIHMRDANTLAEIVDTACPAMTVYKIFLDAYEQVATPNGERYPGVNRAINDLVNRGALIVNYVGHGNERGLAHESIMGKSDIQSWKNETGLPLFITATCEFSRFDEVERGINGEISNKTSAGELVLLNPSGGGIALLTTTRLVYSSPNFLLNQNFYYNVFRRDAKGQYNSLGDMMRITKNLSGPGINKRNFTLLGDPALKLAFPVLRIITDSINGKAITAADTLSALELVTVTGHVEDVSGNTLHDYHGTLFPVVFDKKRSVTTLDNDGYGAMEFKLQNNILYKGKASIREGYFSFSFIIPKDISYAIDHGKISYYASDDRTDGSGSTRQLYIGGFSGTVSDDKKGPDIELYLNNTHFVPGGITDENPVLLAVIHDSSGVNTVGNGIGHDITAELDGNSRDIYILNDYYEAELDNYMKGSIRYPLSGIKKGPHNLKLKVWDVYNNSSEEFLDFVVEESAELALDHVFNYPNPFTTRTAFSFEHNHPGEELEVLVQVFTISGKLVKTIEATILPGGYRSEPIEWDGLDDFGNKIGRGVYIYRIKVRSLSGKTAEKFEKLVILR